MQTHFHQLSHLIIIHLKLLLNVFQTLFAFDYKESAYQFNGWEVYDALEEFKRQVRPSKWHSFIQIHVIILC